MNIPPPLLLLPACGLCSIEQNKQNRLWLLDKVLYKINKVYIKFIYIKFHINKYTV